jgi:hypothetical protein
MALSFKTDIEPIFAPFQAAMRWRFNLLDYQNVRANAQLIYSRISVTESPTGTIPMPPPPMGALSAKSIATFKQWMDDGCPP